jgi:hypothetical protein
LKILKKTGQKRGIFKNVFALLSEEIFELKEKGVSNNAIAKLLSQELGEEIKETALTSWLYRNKNKKASSPAKKENINNGSSSNDENTNPFAFLKNKNKGE